MTTYLSACHYLPPLKGESLFLVTLLDVYVVPSASPKYDGKPTCFLVSRRENTNGKEKAVGHFLA